MAPLPDRKALESMKRIDLQKLCKDYGVKANLKSEALIDLLVETQKPVSRSMHTRRSVSNRQSSRAGPSRVSSIVIHESDDEQQEVVLAIDDSKPNLIPRATRSRKANEQTRLGVGRPKAVGGAGPRAITQSLSISKNKKGRSSRAMQPTEATIPEESEQEAQGLSQGGPQSDIPISDISPQAPAEVTIPNSSLVSLAAVDKHVADAIRPLHQQMKSFKSGVELINTLRTDLGLLTAQANEIGNLREKLETLEAVVQDLRTQAASAVALEIEFKQFKDSLSSRRDALIPDPLTPGMSAQELPSSFISHAAVQFSVQTGPTLLGKRYRDSTTSKVSDNDKEDQMAGDKSKPTRKRPKLSQEADGVKTESQSVERENDEGEDDGEDGLAVSRPFGHGTFEISNQPLEEHSEAPPPDHPSRSPRLGLGSNPLRFPTSTAYAAENQQPFTFSHLPTSSGPSNHIFMPSFPYPEPPQSPSPAGIQEASSSSQQQADRSDPFQTFGFPPPGRSSRLSGSHKGSNLSGGFIDPHALTYLVPETKSVTKIVTTSNAGETGPSTKGSAVEVPQMKRTMYGTELEGDTRFGDFGVEGVGNKNTSFWAGGRL